MMFVTIYHDTQSAPEKAKDKYWKEMSADETQAAKALGWSESSWNEGDTAAFDTNWCAFKPIFR